jgi:PAS domain S-box-containing protein
MSAQAQPSILILDDDAAHAESVRQLLAARDLTAETCTDPLVALPRVLGGEIQLLILDLNMPGLGGLEVLARIAAADIDTRTIVLSGEREVATVGPVLRLGASDYLLKPCDPHQLLASVDNILARIRLERENRAIAAQAEADRDMHDFMLEASPDPVFMLDPQGHFRFANRRFRETFGIYGDVRGMHWTEALGAELATLLQHRFNERRTGERSTRHYEFRHELRSGAERHFDLAATGLYEPTGEPGERRFAGTYGVLRDLTEQREAEAHRLTLQNRLQQASKMEAIGQIAGGIAHDFNNIIASILGFSELVRNAHARLTPVQIETYLDEVIAASHRAKDLIAQMLSFTRASRGAPQAVDVQAALQDVSRMLRAAIPSAIELHTRFAPDPEPVFADPVQLQQIIINLLVNARDAIDGRGHIEVSLLRASQAAPCAACGGRIDGEHMVLAVTDSGHGVSDEVRAQMFEMYFTTREPGKGTGIGLWLVNRLIHEYDGHITVDSAPGAGARFQIHFPRLAAPAQTVADAPVAAASSGRVVVVDDEASVANFMSEVLRDAGFEVVVFTDSLQALRYLEAHHAHVAAVLTDLQMPLMSGLVLAQHIRALRPDLPIALVSAFMEGEATTSSAIDRLLAKPFRIDELLGTLDALLAS